MKTLSVFLSVAFFALIFSFQAMGQGNKSENCNTFPFAGTIPCVDEFVVGKFTQCITLFDSDLKYQWTIRGTYIGKSGKVYEMEQIENYKRKDMERGGLANNKITVVNGVITCQGTPVAVMKLLVHMVWDANGNLRCEIDRGSISWDCL